MTLADLRAALLEASKEAISTRGLLPDQAAQDRWLNRANESIWVDAVERAPQLWRVRGGPYTVTKAAGNLAYSGASGLTGNTTTVYKVVEIRVQDTDGSLKLILPLETAQDVGLYEVQPPAVPGPNNGLPSRWYIEGEAIWFSPVLQQDIVVYARYIPALPSMSATGDLALGGRLQNHHDLVVLKALQLLSKKDEEMATPWDSEVKSGYQSLYRTLRRTQGFSTRRTRKASHY